MWNLIVQIKKSKTSDRRYCPQWSWWFSTWNEYCRNMGWEAFWFKL